MFGLSLKGMFLMSCLTATLFLLPKDHDLVNDPRFSLVPWCRFHRKNKLALVDGFVIDGFVDPLFGALYKVKYLSFVK